MPRVCPKEETAPRKVGESSSSDGVAEIVKGEIFSPCNTPDSCKDNLTTEELSERDERSTRPSSERINLPDRLVKVPCR